MYGQEESKPRTIGREIKNQKLLFLANISWRIIVEILRNIFGRIWKYKGHLNLQGREDEI